MTGIDTSAGELLSKLPWQCAVPDCDRVRMGTLDYCASHALAARKLARDLSKPVKPVKGLKRTPINKQSTKRAYENGRYTEAREIFLKGKRCACCGDPATEVHHKMGRENDLLMEKKYWLPVCSGCHRLITEDSAWAIQNGYSISRNQAKETI